MRLTSVAVLLTLVASSSAAAQPRADPITPAHGEAGLVGTSWKLVRFQGGDGKILTPDDGAKYTIKFGADGAIAARIDCNRGRGTWTSAGPGQLEFRPLALTRVLCPPAPLNDRIVKDWTFVRSYVVKDGHLFLSLMADGGIYEFEPVAGARPVPPKPTEVDIPHGL